MTTVTARASGPRAADEVWLSYCEPSLWSTWSPQIRAVEIDGDRLAVGAEGRIRPWVGPALSFVITGLDEPGRTWSWRVGRGPARVRLDHAVEVTRTGATAIATVHGPALVVLPYLPLMRLALRRLVR